MAGERLGFTQGQDSPEAAAERLQEHFRAVGETGREIKIDLMSIGPEDVGKYPGLIAVDLAPDESRGGHTATIVADREFWDLAKDN